MSKPKCPKCRREGTYSQKFGQCSACGRGYGEQKGSDVTEDVSDVTPITDVTPKVMKSVTPVTEVTPDTVKPGEVCSQCGERKPSVAALKQRAWRKRREQGD